MRVPNPTPVLDKNRTPMGPEILSSTGAGAWRKAPMAFPDSSSVLDKFQWRLVQFLVKNLKFPNFIVKLANKSPHQKGGGFSCFQVSLSFFCMPSFALVFLFSLCFLISWSRQICPPHELLSGCHTYMFVCLFVCLFVLFVLFCLFVCLLVGAGWADAAKRNAGSSSNLSRSGAFRKASCTSAVLATPWFLRQPFCPQHHKDKASCT